MDSCTTTSHSEVPESPPPWGSSEGFTGSSNPSSPSPRSYYGDSSQNAEDNYKFFGHRRVESERYVLCVRVRKIITHFVFARSTRASSSPGIVRYHMEATHRSRPGLKDQSSVTV
jgi:hypothetical protein